MQNYYAPGIIKLFILEFHENPNSGDVIITIFPIDGRYLKNYPTNKRYTLYCVNVQDHTGHQMN